MKKILVMSMGAMLLLSSCGTYTGSGAYAGGMFGSIIGSAVGGITGGWRGSDVGSLIGLAGGAAVGAAIGAAADKAEADRYAEYQERRMEDRERRLQDRERRLQERSERQRDYQNRQNAPQKYDDGDESGFDANNGGDDRLYGFGEDFSVVAPDAQQSLEIRNPRIVDASRDGVLVRGEEARMVFEIYNNSSKPVFRVLPTVAEVTGNKHIHISQNVMVESIQPGKGIRYTAVIKADSGLREGEAVIRIGVMQADKEIASQSREFSIKTSKR